MTINRRRAPSSRTSSEKKKRGHENEKKYAALIGGTRILGVRKGDIRDRMGKLHSVKSGDKKWQGCLYGYATIADCRFLDILKPCLEAFPQSSEKYFSDREECIAYKESYLEKHGKSATKALTNEDLAHQLGKNEYMESKARLAASTQAVCAKLRDEKFLRNFVREALFNNDEVAFLVVHDSTNKKDCLFKVFEREEVLDVLIPQLSPAISRAGFVPVDYNVGGQKTLLVYTTDKNRSKNIVEIEIRNDESHYRKLRFNMYSKDTLALLLRAFGSPPAKELCSGVLLYGRAADHTF